jgi:hypothetical protein
MAAQWFHDFHPRASPTLVHLHQSRNEVQRTATVDGHCPPHHAGYGHSDHYPEME